jgi:hypothetical protein
MWPAVRKSEVETFLGKCAKIAARDARVVGKNPLRKATTTVEVALFVVFENSPSKDGYISRPTTLMICHIRALSQHLQQNVP